MTQSQTYWERGMIQGSASRLFFNPFYRPVRSSCRHEVIREEVMSMKEPPSFAL